MGHNLGVVAWFLHFTAMVLSRICIWWGRDLFICVERHFDSLVNAIIPNPTIIQYRDFVVNECLNGIRGLDFI